MSTPGIALTALTCGADLCRGISGGQAKRANIAIAMVVDPRVLFLDVRRSCPHTVVRITVAEHRRVCRW